jgi:hypothetical protein
MEALLTALEGSSLGDVLRGSGVRTYGFVNLGHVFGISLLIGSIVLLDLRLLGAWRQAPLTAITRPTVRLAGVGLVIAVITGICMLMFNGSDYVGNPYLLYKLGAIALGLVNVAVMTRLPAWRAKEQRTLSAGEARQLAIGGGISLVSWLAALFSGRMIAYW